MSVSEMDTATCDNPQITREEAAVEIVADIMLRHPKTLPATATLDDARAFFANPKVINAVVTSGTKFIGVLNRSDLPSLLAGSTPIHTFARREVPTTVPTGPVPEVTAVLDELRLDRMVVLEEDGETLAGLICLDRQRAGFCRG